MSSLLLPTNKGEECGKRCRYKQAFQKPPAHTKDFQLDFSLLNSTLLIPNISFSVMANNKDSESGSGLDGPAKGKRTRRRVINCCENCRSSKNKCSKHPDGCERCLASQLKCIYLPQDKKGWDLIEKGKEERRDIEDRIVKKARRADESEEGFEDGSDIEPSPLIATDAAHEDDDDNEDNGVQIGRFNLTKRIGSNYRPKMIEEASSLRCYLMAPKNAALLTSPS